MTDKDTEAFVRTLLYFTPPGTAGEVVVEAATRLRALSTQLAAAHTRIAELESELQIASDPF
jgi:hypothetical protein